MVFFNELSAFTSIIIREVDLLISLYEQTARSVIILIKANKFSSLDICDVFENRHVEVDCCFYDLIVLILVKLLLLKGLSADQPTEVYKTVVVHSKEANLCFTISMAVPNEANKLSIKKVKHFLRVFFVS